MKHGARRGEWEAEDSNGKLREAVGKKLDGAWTTTHLWVFENVDGERRHTRRVHVVDKDGRELDVRMVDDFDGNRP